MGGEGVRGAGPGFVHRARQYRRAAASVTTPSHGAAVCALGGRPGSLRLRAHAAPAWILPATAFFSGFGRC